MPKEDVVLRQVARLTTKLATNYCMAQPFRLGEDINVMPAGGGLYASESLPTYSKELLHHAGSSLRDDIAEFLESAQSYMCGHSHPAARVPLRE